MSTKIAEYKFNDYDDWTAAKNRLSDALGYNYSDSISSSDTNWITIWDNCNNPKTAGQICKANGGEI